MALLLRRLAGSAFALGVALAACAPAAAEPPVWTAHGAAGSQVTLFGSVHLLQETTHWKSAAVDALLAGADRLMFEIPMDEAAQAGVAGKLLELGRLPGDELLRPQLSPAARERLERQAEKLGLPIASVDHMQPWLAEVLVSVSYFQRAGARADLGVEHQIELAAPPKIDKAAFESIEDQLQALSGGARADQLKALEETLEEIDTDPDGFARLAEAWARGDVKTIEKEGIEDMRAKAPGAYQRLVVGRNKRWVGEIEDLLKRPGRTFAVVGIGHLVGPDSVPTLLRRDGVVVDGPR